MSQLVCDEQIENYFAEDENNNVEKLGYQVVSDSTENPCNTSTSTNNESDASALSCTKLKSILKKPRSLSFSETETHLAASYNPKFMRKSFCSSGCDSTIDESSELTGSKKSVHFNNQIIRNVFKVGSTIVGMKKPNSNKNKKKNRRKRTMSDPSHDHEHNHCENNENHDKHFFFRTRGCSESSDFSDDSSSASAYQTTSDDNFEENDELCVSGTKTGDNFNNQNQMNGEKKKKKKKKKNKSNNKTNSNNFENFTNSKPDNKQVITSDQSTKSCSFNMKTLINETNSIEKQLEAS